MSIIVPAVLGGLAIAVMALVSIAAARKGRHASAIQGNQPRILIHSINDDRCTGCDACVAVCPTNVLDLVDNKSRVLRFQDCIQCEACMWACPTTALVMHLEGTSPPQLKMPELDEHFQTAVPGQYLIGEVAGKPLVKNAANLGRAVVEHMLKSGLSPWGQSGAPGRVDVAIVGSGPAGLSAALTCIQRGLSYVLLEKEQVLASTISRYPKGKFVMAEPYDVRNLSLLPVFDSSKEQLVATWEDLIGRTGLEIRKGEAVEEIGRQGDGTFQVRTTVGSYVSQRVVLATGTRGKPRTVGVQGENLPKVRSLLEDPDDFRGQPVIVIGGGDSAVEAAMALADAGAKVVLSYRGRSFNRCAPKNRQAIESYDAQRRVKVRYQSNVMQFTEEHVTLQMQDGTKKTYPNTAAFVLIGADPPIKWLQKVGVNFVERPHEYSFGKSDEMVMRFLGADVMDCPEDPAVAAEIVTHGRAPQGMAAAAAAAPPAVDLPAPGSGPRRWLRTATSMFTQSRKIEQPMPLSEFARRTGTGTGTHTRVHSGHGRRDALDASERTRILRMLRDEGGRIADEESRVGIPAAPPAPGAHVEHSPAPEFLDPGPPPPVSPVRSSRQPALAPPAPPAASSFAPPAAPPPAPPASFSRDNAPASRRMRLAQNAPSFNDEPTRQVDKDQAIAELLRDASAQRRPRPNLGFQEGNEEATRAVDMSALARQGRKDHGFGVHEEATRVADALRPEAFVGHEEPTRAVNISSVRAPGGRAAEPAYPDTEDATRAVNLEELQRLNARSKRPFDDEATRAVNLKAYPPDKGPKDLNDVDWDLD